MAKKNRISDELLAAYLDGNTNEAETRMVLEALQDDAELRETLDIAIQVEGDEDAAYDVLPMMKLAAESGRNICSVLCEAYVMHRRGGNFKEQELLAIAEEHHWLTAQGVPLYAIGQLLTHYGMMVVRRYDATMDAICHALSLDNDVVVVVDSDKLYEGREDKEDEPNHAVVVKAVDQQQVLLFDPSEPNTRVAVPVTRFLNAWKESNNFMVQVLQTVGDYEPRPINVDQIPLNDDLAELQEAIAENAHEVWAQARMKDGWTYGPERDDANKKHPDLIPYSSLPDSEKEYDRLMAFNTIKLVKKLGFDIVKR